MNTTQHQFTQNIGKLIQYATLMGFGLSFGYAYRSFEEQQQLYYAGLTGTVDSQHFHRLAVDFYVWLDGHPCRNRNHLKFLGDYWESLHPRNHWGGVGNEGKRFLEHLHLEMRQL